MCSEIRGQVMYGQYIKNNNSNLNLIRKYEKTTGTTDKTHFMLQI